jgi:hypothetical protein
MQRRSSAFPRSSTASGASADSAGSPRWLTGREAERFGEGPAVVLGQDFAEVAGPAGDGTEADKAARDRKMGNGHREAAGTGIAHHLYDSSPAGATLPCAMRAAAARGYPRNRGGGKGEGRNWPLP